MIKLKDILKENSPGFKNRQFGDPLPTVDDIAKNYQNKKKQSVNEAKGYHPELKIPSDVSYYERDWVAVFKEWGIKRSKISPKSFLPGTVPIKVGLPSRPKSINQKTG